MELYLDAKAQRKADRVREEAHAGDAPEDLHGHQEEGLRREVQLEGHRKFARDVQAHGRPEERLRGEHLVICLPKLRSIRVRLRL